VTIAIDGTTPAAVVVASGNAATASFTAPSGALLLAVADMGSTLADGDVGSAISDSGGLSWTLVDRQRGAGYDEAVMWWAITGSATSRTVTASATTNTLYKFLQTLVITGAHPSAPIGAKTKGQIASGTLSASVTSTAVGSLAVGSYADWNAAAVPTADANTTRQSGNQGASTGACLYKTALSGSVGQSLAVGTTAPTAKITYVLAEILPAPAASTFVPRITIF